MRLAQKGDSKSGDRPFARRPDQQNPPGGARARLAGALYPDGRPAQRHHPGQGADRRPAGSMGVGRYRLRRRSLPRRHRGHQRPGRHSLATRRGPRNCRSTSTSTRKGIWSNAASTSSSTFAASPPATRRPRGTSSPSSPSRPSLCGYDDCQQDLVETGTVTGWSHRAFDLVTACPCTVDRSVRAHVDPKTLQCAAEMPWHVCFLRH